MASIKESEPKYNHLKEASKIITGKETLPGMQLFYENDPNLHEKLRKAGRQSTDIANLTEELRNSQGLRRLLVKARWRLKSAIEK